MVFRTADGGFVLDYREPVLVASPTSTAATGSSRRFHRRQEEVIFGIRIREESAGGETDPQKVKGKKERRFGEAISLFQGSWRASRKPT